MLTFPAARRRLAELPKRPWAPVALDAVLALACWGNALVQASLKQEAHWWVVLLATGNAVPLLWRRRFPFEVTLVVGVFTTWLAVVGALGHVPAAQLVATYSFAAYCPPVRGVLAVIGTIVGIAVSILVPREDALNLGPTAAMFAVAYALGSITRIRRAQIALLEERARRLAEERAAAATRERERIAREMHDILAHTMSLVVVQAEAGPVVVRSDPDKAEQVFETIAATAREALAQLRRALGVLRSDEPDREPQPDLSALSALVSRVRETGLAVTLEERGTPVPVPADFAVTVYRIVQESLTNTVKHAHARQAWVRLDWGDGVLGVEVRDDGRGPDGGDAGGHGLVGMWQRVAALGGEIRCGAGPDGVGYLVAARLPLQ